MLNILYTSVVGNTNQEFYCVSVNCKNNKL